MSEYVELHLHSNYSFAEGASSIAELVARASELGYKALALTDHDNLCGAMDFAKAARGVGIQPIIGAEATLVSGHHLTLLAETRKGYSNLCWLLSQARKADREHPAVDPKVLPGRTEGLIALSGCRRGEVPTLVQNGDLGAAQAVAEQYRSWFGPANYFLELQQHRVKGDLQRNRRLVALAGDLDVGVVATNNVHYHVRERHMLHDCLVAIQHNKSLAETHPERRATTHFWLKLQEEMAQWFRAYPEAIANTARIAERCRAFDLTKDLAYHFPDYDVPAEHTPDTYLEKLCVEAAGRRYGGVNAKLKTRLVQELGLIRKHGLAGFFLLYRDIVRLAQEVAVDLGIADPEVPVEISPPGRGRGSSVAMVVGYLLGLSHIDPLEFDLSLERFLPADQLGSVPDIDLDFPRAIREELILRVHKLYGPDRAALTGMIVTYRIRGAIRDLGRALGLPADTIDQLAKRVDEAGASTLRDQMLAMPEYQDKVDHWPWSHLVELAAQLDGFPRSLAQHPGGMVISSTPITELVPVQPSAMDGRYIMQWDKNAIDDVGMVKIDFLALGALSAMQRSVAAIERRHGKTLDLSRIDFDDQAVYDLICEADTIGLFQVESAAQRQTTPRLRPRNLIDLAHEVGAVRPGVGVHDGVRRYIRRRLGQDPVMLDHPLEERALGRTLGVPLFQDQLVQLAVDAAGFTQSDANQLRKVFTLRNNETLIQQWWLRFRDGAARQGIDEATARTIYGKFTGHYMFPESHAIAFGATCFQHAYLKVYYPLEFYLGLMNEQPMGFYTIETLKEDARHHGVTMLVPDVNRSQVECVDEGNFIRLGLGYVQDIGKAATESVMDAREHGPFRSLPDFMARTGLEQRQVELLVDAGAFDSLCSDRRQTRWEVGLRYRPVGEQGQLALSVEQDRAALPEAGAVEEMRREYASMGIHPAVHVMAYIRPKLEERVLTSRQLAELPDGARVTVAGLIIRRQRPLARAVFLTLEDEFGHAPFMAWPKVYERYKRELKQSLVVCTGTLSRREGTMNVMLESARTLPIMAELPKSHDFR